MTFAMGTPRGPERFGLQQSEELISTAVKEGCLYYVTPFPRDGFLECMKEFAKAVMPSFSSLD